MAFSLIWWNHSCSLRYISTVVSAIYVYLVKFMLKSSALTGYLAINLTLNISIPSFSGKYPVISVNNWIVFQQRIDSSTSFSLGWSSYKSGFGLYNGNYWMGLEKVYQMTKSGTCRARFEILNDLNQWLSMGYGSFSLESESTNYTIHITGYVGEITNDPMNLNIGVWKHNGMAFSTIDRDNDKWVGGSCALGYGGGGGWWFNACRGVSFDGGHSTMHDFRSAMMTTIQFQANKIGTSWRSAEWWSNATD